MSKDNQQKKKEKGGVKFTGRWKRSVSVW